MLRLSAGLAPASVISTLQPRSHCRRESPKLQHGRSFIGWPSGLLCRAVVTARPIRPSGQPRPALISVLSIAFSFYSALFSTFRWPAALSSGQRRWRFPPCGTLPTAEFFLHLPNNYANLTTKQIVLPCWLLRDLVEQ